MREPISIGVTSWTLAERGLSAPLIAAAFGFEHLHVDMFDAPDPETAEHLAQASHDAGLTIAAYSISEIELRGSSAISPAAVAETARALNAPLIYLPCFGVADARDPENAQSLSHLLRALLDHFEGLVAFESLLDANAARRLLSSVASPRLRVLFDTQNPISAGQDPYALGMSLLDVLAPDLHLKDGIDGLGNRMIGDGRANPLATLAALDAGGWCGRITLETDYTRSIMCPATEQDRIRATLRRGPGDPKK